MTGCGTLKNCLQVPTSLLIESPFNLTSLCWMVCNPAIVPFVEKTTSWIHLLHLTYTHTHTHTHTHTLCAVEWKLVCVHSWVKIHFLICSLMRPRWENFHDRTKKKSQSFSVQVRTKGCNCNGTSSTFKRSASPNHREPLSFAKAFSAQKVTLITVLTLPFNYAQLHSTFNNVPRVMIGRLIVQ